MLSLDDATYRMCYKITDLPFGNTSTVTNQTLYVYADEFEKRDGYRSAIVRFSFYKDGETRISRKSVASPSARMGISLSIRMMITSMPDCMSSIRTEHRAMSSGAWYWRGIRNTA